MGTNLLTGPFLSSYATAYLQMYIHVGAVYFILYILYVIFSHKYLVYRYLIYITNIWAKKIYTQ